MAINEEQKQKLMERGLTERQIENLERSEGRTSITQREGGVSGAIAGFGKGVLNYYLKILNWLFYFYSCLC